MPLGRQRLLQRFFNLHHCIATTRAKQKRTATPPRKWLSRPMTSIANVGEHRRASASADRAASLRMTAILTMKNDLVVKTTAICKNSFRSTGDRPTAVPPTRRLCRPGQPGPTNSLARVEQPDSPSRTARQPRSNDSSAVNPNRTVRQLGSNSSSAQINQFLTYALRTLTSIDARTAHAIKFIGNQTKRRKAHGERYHERHKQNRELHDRPLSANAKAPIACSPREFRERIKPLSTSAGKVQFVGISMSHERKAHAKRRSKMKFNF